MGRSRDDVTMQVLAWLCGRALGYDITLPRQSFLLRDGHTDFQGLESLSDCAVK